MMWNTLIFSMVLVARSTSALGRALFSKASTKSPVRPAAPPPRTPPSPSLPRGAQKGGVGSKQTPLKNATQPGVEAEPLQQQTKERKDATEKAAVLSSMSGAVAAAVAMFTFIGG